MKRFLLVFTFLLFLISCNRTEKIIYEDIEDGFSNLSSFGSTTTLEVMTWNLENFAKNNDKTIEYVKEIIEDLDVDIIALQEIKSEREFEQLDLLLEDWFGYKQNSSAYDFNLAFLVRKSISVLSVEEIYTDETDGLPRSPYILTFQYNNQEFKLINNHLKSGGDPQDLSRRREGVRLLKEYIDFYLPNDNVILVGDLNDDIIDDDNVFELILNDPMNYVFADMEIAEGNSSHWSYPTWPSHIDHILLSNELFDEFQHNTSRVKCIQIHDFLTRSWATYETNVSDHLPVAIKLFIE